MYSFIRTRLVFSLFAIVSIVFFLVIFPAISSATETNSSLGRSARVDATCMQTAVGTREESLLTAWEEYTSDITSALKQRKSALYDAWGVSEIKDRNAAIKSAWKSWKESSRSAHVQLKKDRKAAWETFKKTVRTSCKISTPKDESLGKDSSGTISL